MDRNALTGSSSGIYPLGGEGKRTLFAVVPGVPLLEALEGVSTLLSIIQDPIHDTAMGNPLDESVAWMINHTLESAKAALDAAIDGLEFPESGAPAKE